MGTLAVFRSDGVATSLYVFDTGRVDVGFQTWFTHRDARPYYAKVHGRLAAAAARKRATELAESVAAIERAARGTR